MIRKKFLFTLMAIFSLLALAIPAAPVSAAPASQTPLDPTTIPQFVDRLPILDITGAPNGTIKTIVAGTSQIELDMKEFKANMLPSTFVPETGTYDGTYVWGYVTPGTNTSVTRDTYTGPVIVATRNVPTQVKWVNDLPSTDNTKVLFYNNSTDQSLHWANPNMIMDKYTDISNLPDYALGNPDHYSGMIPAAVHLHGAEDPAAIDGGPDSWFTNIAPNTSVAKHGPTFYSMDGNTGSNYSIYRYPNVQEAAPLWFHDHTLGATRLNVYAGLAGGYVLTDPNLKLPKGLGATGLERKPANPVDDTVIPLVIQDRMFDTNGELYFPNQGINPEHQYWIPEFFGDTIAVNGKVWPYLDVKAQRYEFLMINGSNARSYELTFQGGGNSAAPTIWQIGTDQGYLDNPVQVNPLVIMPGERAEFIVDFSGVTPGTKLTLKNLGPDEPFNGTIGAQTASDPATTGQVMQFRLSASTLKKDDSYDPAKPGQALRNGNDAIVRLVNPANGTLAKGVTPDLTRELTLNEIAREEPITVGDVNYSGGPLEILVNNTKWMGARPNESDPNQMDGLTPVNGGVPDGLGNYLTEMPKEGTTEIWEIVNTTMDAHPMHTHLAQFQLLNRQSYITAGFNAAYAAAFPDGAYIPAYGPPLAYSPSNASGGKYGGNPDVTPYLTGAIKPPNPNEAGWKDTVLVPPNSVTRFVVRWAPTDLSVKAKSATLHYAFLPNDTIPGKPGAIFDYVWHCHIVDHEDNEMMRPDAVVPMNNAPRTFRIGVDY